MYVVCTSIGTSNIAKIEKEEITSFKQVEKPYSTNVNTLIKISKFKLNK